ncbi:MAG: hypothetical protein JNM18_23265 [Planctomycetaceae bacterium]|nr:hypothetical protein [Planctomycetaceae bacterium]
MDLRRCTTALLAGLVLLPIAILAALGIAGLLGVLGDRDGSLWLGRLAALGGIAWVVDLVALVGAIAAQNLGCCGESGGSCHSAGSDDCVSK